MLFYGIAQQPTLRIVMEFVPGRYIFSPSVFFYFIIFSPFFLSDLSLVFSFIKLYYSGTDLGKVLYANTLNHYEPPVEWQLRVMYDIACAMQYLHNLQPPITHRDLRSPNVLVCTSTLFFFFFLFLSFSFFFFCFHACERRE